MGFCTAPLGYRVPTSGSVGGSDDSFPYEVRRAIDRRHRRARTSAQEATVRVRSRHLRHRRDHRHRHLRPHRCRGQGQSRSSRSVPSSSRWPTTPPSSRRPSPPNKPLVCRRRCCRPCSARLSAGVHRRRHPAPDQAGSAGPSGCRSARCFRRLRCLPACSSCST